MLLRRSSITLRSGATSKSPTSSRPQPNSIAGRDAEPRKGRGVVVEVWSEVFRTNVQSMRRTKIIATLGPAVASAESIGDLVAAGMDVARLNFSHGTHETKQLLADWVRAASKEHGRNIAILQDIQGPKLRVGRFPGGSISLKTGSTIRLVPDGGGGSAEVLPLSYEYLLEDVAPGEMILLADGLIRLQVEQRLADSLEARVIDGGELSDNKGVAFPETVLRVPSITDKDREDLEFGVELGVDYVAASFVRTAADIEEVSGLAGGIPVIAKIELTLAYENLDEILGVAYGAMVARGDLGVQMELQKLPLVQRDILSRTNAAGCISITATEMLESMTSSPRPTRAEVTDVANAVLNGTDAVMLSGETAVGDYPVAAVDYMDRICREAESGLDTDDAVDFLTSHRTFASAIAKAGVEVADNLGLRTIVAFTETGSTALLLSKYRPQARIVAFTPDPATERRMALFWGVQAIPFVRRDFTDLMIASAEKYLEKNNLCEPGEGVVMVAGIPPNEEASTNLMKVHVIGERSRGVRPPH